MPDWLAHILTAWITCRLLSLRLKTFDSRATSIVMTGSLIPDIVKAGYLFEFLDIDAWTFHTAVGVILTSGIIVSFISCKVAVLKVKDEHENGTG